MSNTTARYELRVMNLDARRPVAKVLGFVETSDLDALVERRWRGARKETAFGSIRYELPHNEVMFARELGL
ncbi:MAG: hypothetical protein ACRC4O_06515 [Giesbergeria sp.]